MPRLIIEIVRTAAAAGTGDYPTKTGPFNALLGETLDAVRMIVLEGYSITGIQNTAGVPAQSYLMCNIADGQNFLSTVPVASNVSHRPEDGVALPIVSVPYTHQSYDVPTSRVLYVNDGGKSMNSFRVSVRGPDGAVPLFNTLTLFLRYDFDVEKPARIPRNVIASGVDSELPHNDGPILSLRRGNYGDS